MTELKVCGAPLTRDLFTSTGELCRASRKRCVKHYRWERLRRAQIDMEKVRQVGFVLIFFFNIHC